ncbi:MAG: DUF4271 domain-containing protein [Ferruginibacter sp.]
MLKQTFIFLLSLFLIPVCAIAQQVDSLTHQGDSLSQPQVNMAHDSISADTTHKADTVIVAQPLVKKKASTLAEILKDNIFLNSSSKPDSFIITSRKYISKDIVFYILSIVLLFLGILKVSWPRYFGNLIRVFFNTSLRQGQLTDQLLQAKLPSLFFNLFFVLISGWYLYLLLNHFGKDDYSNWKLLSICIIGLLLIYLVKFCTLKFAGWLTGYKQEAETYIFIVFLINKIIALCLVPVVIIIPFSNPGLVNTTIIISYAIIVLMFVMRFFRSYGLLQSRLKVSGLHFFIYIIGVELLPLLLIYRFALVIMSKNL